eukprot:364899-Chlamydomonas_euryale.AAC.32
MSHLEAVTGAGVFIFITDAAMAIVIVQRKRQCGGAVTDKATVTAGRVWMAKAPTTVATGGPAPA